MAKYHLFYRGWTKRGFNGVTYTRWYHSNCCWCLDDMQDMVFPAAYLYHDGEYIWKERDSENYWGDNSGNPIKVEELLGKGF